MTAADDAAALEPADLELLATSAYMLGRDEEYLAVLERAHHAHVDAGEPLRAARCAFWSGMHLLLRGEMGRGTGWLGRAQRLVALHAEECVEQGYLLMPLAFRQEAEGDLDGGAAIAGRAAGIAQRFGDRDLFGLAVHVQGHLLVEANRIAEGLALLDEAMLAVTTGELSPIASGIVYCGVILGCQQAYEPRRAQEWTAALTEWCESQPDMVAFTGRCMTHRAEIMLLRGEWPAASTEARRAGARAAQANNRTAVGDALCLEADIRRLRGDLDAADEAYREANRSGCEPQPGLSLLQLARGDAAAAAAAIRRALGETADVWGRTRLLPACVEIMLADGDVAAAHSACDELEGIAAGRGSEVLDAIVAHARGSVDLAEGDAAAALPRASPRVAGVAGGRGAVRDGSRARPHEPRLPRARRRRRRRDGAGGGARDLPAARRGVRPRADRRARRYGRRPRTHGSRAAGAAARRDRSDEPCDRRRARAERADGGPSREQHLREAGGLVADRRGGLRLRAGAGVTRRRG